MQQTFSYQSHIYVSKLKENKAMLSGPLYVRQNGIDVGVQTKEEEEEQEEEQEVQEKRVLIVKFGSKKKDIVGSHSFVIKENVEQIFFHISHTCRLENISGHSAKNLYFSKTTDPCFHTVLLLKQRQQPFCWETFEIFQKTFKLFDIYFYANPSQVLEKPIEHVPLVH